MKLISSVNDAPLAYNDYRQKESGDDLKPSGSMYRAWAFEAVGRGRSVQVVESMPCWEVDPASTHVVIWTWSV